ncbi:vitellogenin receptor-like [Planococcus citri]|uniref:vitellogenin receptor-like n=1 Tax=Planococcus citri TaxID=170843 RepID=UPI0031F75012
MIKVKYCCRSCTTIFVVVLSVFHMQSCLVITTENAGSLDIIVKTDNETRFTCNNGTSIRESQTCDGITDCPDNEDEGDCVYSAPSCRPGEFKCRDCIPGILLCDREVDCYDGNDEADCFCNVIGGIFTKDESLNEGDTFNTTCIVYGEPIPEIAWYRNGEPVPSKCTSTRDHRTGVLTCPNIELADEGVYSCKGIEREKFTVRARSITSDLRLKVDQKKPEKGE